MLCELRVLARLFVRTMYDRNAIRFAILPKSKCAIQDLKRDREVHPKRVCFLFPRGQLRIEGYSVPEHCLLPVRAQTEISRAALHAQTCKNGFGPIRHETNLCKRTGSKTVQTAKRKQNSTAEKEATKAATEQGKQQCNASVNPSEATSRTHVYNASKTQLETHV